MKKARNWRRLSRKVGKRRVWREWRRCQDSSRKARWGSECLDREA
jgi:hypothetical protein